MPALTTTQLRRLGVAVDVRLTRLVTFASCIVEVEVGEWKKEFG